MSDGFEEGVPAVREPESVRVNFAFVREHARAVERLGRRRVFLIGLAVALAVVGVLGAVFMGSLYMLAGVPLALVPLLALIGVRNKKDVEVRVLESVEKACRKQLRKAWAYYEVSTGALSQLIGMVPSYRSNGKGKVEVSLDGGAVQVVQDYSGECLVIVAVKREVPFV